MNHQDPNSGTPTEIPILFPSLEVTSSPHTCCTGVFCVDVGHELLYPQEELQQQQQQEDGDLLRVDETMLRGMASVSSIHLNRSVLTVTTSACVDAPELLNVALILEGSVSNEHYNNSNNKLLRLNFSKSPQLGSIVRVQAFGSAMNNNNTVELVIVGTDGYIVVIRINLDTWTPCGEGGTTMMDPIFVVSVPALLDRHSSNGIMTTFGLTQERVAILDKNRVLLATNPLLLAVSLGGGPTAFGEPKLAAWSLKHAKNPGSGSSSLGISSYLFTSLMGSGSSTKLLPDKDTPLDMNPIVSLCIAGNDPTTVFTFHSGGIFRRWYCATGDLLPTKVKDVNVDDMPAESDWSDEPIRIVGHVYDDFSDVNYCAAIFFQTTTSSSSLMPETPTGGSMFTDDNNALGGSRLIVTAENSRGTTSHAVNLPEGPSSLVGAAFGGTSPSLTVLIANEEGSAAMLHYGTAEQNTIVQLTPQIASGNGSLDHLAGQELWCLDYLSSPSFTSFHETDVRYLQFLFRPISCRGVGHTLPPSASRIRMALQKCIPGYSRNSNTTGSSTQQSIAAQVLTAMHEWRVSNNEETNASEPSSYNTLLPVHKAPTTPGGTTVRSFYESLQNQEGEDEEGIPMVNLESPVHAPPKPRTPPSKKSHPDTPSADELEKYKQLWQLLLIQIWQEEAVDRIPLVFCAEKGIILRSGVVSSIATDPPHIDQTPLLDRLAVRIAELVDKNGDLALRLHLQEQRIVQALSNCTVDMSPTAKDVAHELSILCQTQIGEAVSRDELQQLKNLLHNNMEQLIRQVQQIPSNLVGIGFSPTNRDGSGNETNSIANEKTPMNVQARLAATSLFTRRVDDARRLFLGRYLVLRVVNANQLVAEAAWLGYLRASSLLVASAQHVPSLKGFPSTLDLDHNSPPKKRPSFDSSQSDSLLISSGVTESTTALDAFLTSVYQNSQPLDTQDDPFVYLPACTRSMSRLTRVAMQRMLNARQSTFSQEEFPELRFITSKSSRGAAWDQPKLAVILLSPHVSAAPASEAAATQARLEIIAECLLMLSSNYPEETAERMVDRAFEILHFDPRDLAEGFRRISTLSQHAVGTSKLVEKIHAAVVAVNGEYAAEFLATSSEYAKLVSLLFYKSLEAHEWGQALVACRSNPSREQRLDHLQRLVTAMIDSGALSALLVMCSSGEDREHGEFARGMDLYGIAVETLGKAGYRDWYTHRANGSEALSDYQGALYALHASRGEWRRAAQALDLRYVNAINALQLDESKLLSTSGFAMDKTTSNKRTLLILDDLVLAAAGGCNALCLVDQVESRFIISGENGKLPTLPITKFDDEEDIVRLKRSRGQMLDKDRKTSSSADDDYRLARYKDQQDLQTRAFIAMGVRRLWIAGLISLPLAKKFLSEKEDPGRTIQVLIRELFKAGCYDLGLILALQTEESMPGRAEGRGIFQEAISYLLCDHLVPLVVGVAVDPKPTLNQILVTLDAVSESSSPPVPLSRAPKKKEDPGETAIRFAAMALLERITTKYTTAEMPLAKEVADCLIVDHKTAELPQWLVSLLIHGSDPSIDAPGLFAKRPKPGSSTYLGDPCALLNIYMMAGMYHSGCELVSTVLDPKGRKPESAARRLPEKGEMDFVPFDKIDQLYNLIDAAIENGDIYEEYEEIVLSAREKMVQALDEHFRRLAISEAGLNSARILASTG